MNTVLVTVSRQEILGSLWKPIPENPAFLVNPLGVVRHGFREPKQTPNHKGYLKVRIGPVKRFVHCLVLEAFVGPRPSRRHHGAHLDGDKTNNCLSNLEWKLPEDNEADKRKHGTHAGGGRVWRPNRERVARIRARAQGGESYASIAKSEGLHPHSVSRIVRGLRRAGT
jgi:hypothetical protein